MPSAKPAGRANTRPPWSWKRVAGSDEYEYKKKGVFPNVDFFSGIVYQSLGIPVDLFTPIFAIARVVGWLSHWLEQIQNNRIYRPGADLCRQARRAVRAAGAAAIEESTRRRHRRLDFLFTFSARRPCEGAFGHCQGGRALNVNNPL